MLEKDIEKSVCDYAKFKGIEVYKFVSPGHRSVPDRMFILPEGVVFFIEFKATGKKATPLQAREHDRLRRIGCHVYVVDDIDIGKLTIELELKIHAHA